MVCGLQFENQYFKNPILPEQFAKNFQRGTEGISDIATF
jgi:hypothetical protein